MNRYVNEICEEMVTNHTNRVATERANFEPQNESNIPNASRRQFVQVNISQDEISRQNPKLFDTSNWTYTRILSMVVVLLHISLSAYIASNCEKKLVKVFAVIALFFNILLWYGIVKYRKETMIAWLAFYGILAFIAMSCISPELKVCMKFI